MWPLAEGSVVSTTAATGFDSAAGEPDGVRAARATAKTAHREGMCMETLRVGSREKSLSVLVLPRPAGGFNCPAAPADRYTVCDTFVVEGDHIISFALRRRA